MKYSCGLWCLLAGIVGLLQAVTPTEVSGQWARSGRPAERFDRWLGVGNGAGYHWRTPGPNVDYYQPWSQLNTVGWNQGYGYFIAPLSQFEQQPAWPIEYGEPSFPALVPTPAIPENPGFPMRREDSKPPSSPQSPPPVNSETTWQSPASESPRQAQRWFNSLQQQGRIYQR